VTYDVVTADVPWSEITTYAV